MLQPGLDAAQARDAIGLEPGAVDERAGAHRAARGLEDQVATGLALARRPRARPSSSSPPRARAVARRSDRDHARVVDDAGLRHEQPGDAARRAGSSSRISSGPSRRMPREAVGAAAPLELVERRQLAPPWSRRPPCRSARAAMPCSAQKRYMQLAALDAVARLQRAGLVVEAGVDDAAVVPALVAAEPRLRPRARRGVRARSRSRARAPWRARRCRRR